MSGFEMFVRTIPFNLYAMLTLYMVFFTSLLGFDFGLMKSTSATPPTVTCSPLAGRHSKTRKLRIPPRAVNSPRARSLT